MNDLEHTASHIHGMILSCVLLAGLSPLFVLFLRRSFYEDGNRRGIWREWRAVVAWITICLSFGFLVFPPIFGHVHREHSDHISPNMLTMGGIVILIIGFFCYCLNLLARLLRKREEELLQLQSRQRDDALLASLTSLAAGAAHELCSPLTTIAIVAKEIERKHISTTNGGEVAADAQVIRLQVERCRTIIQQMSDPLRETPLVPVSVRLSLLMSTIQATANLRNPRLRLVWSSNTDVVMIAEPLLVRILQNLVENAVDASKDDDSIVIRFEEKGQLLLLSVQDSGSGISQELTSELGRPFVSTKERGHGLGLFLVRSLAERFGNGIMIESSPGKGTTVRVELFLAHEIQREDNHAEENRSYR